jgi:hypothetical protein
LSLHTQMLCSIAELSIGPLLFNSNSEKITPGNATLNPQKYAHAADDDKKSGRCGERHFLRGSMIDSPQICQLLVPRPCKCKIDGSGGE